MQRLPEAVERERERRGGTGETRIENEPRDTMVRLGEQKMDRVKTERNETNTRQHAAACARRLHARFEKIRKQTTEKAIASSARSFLRVIRTPRPKGVNYQAVLDPGGRSAVLRRR